MILSNWSQGLAYRSNVKARPRLRRDASSCRTTTSLHSLLSIHGSKLTPKRLAFELQALAAPDHAAGRTPHIAGQDHLAGQLCQQPDNQTLPRSPFLDMDIWQESMSSTAASRQPRSGIEAKRRAVPLAATATRTVLRSACSF